MTAKALKRSTSCVDIDISEVEGRAYKTCLISSTMVTTQQTESQSSSSTSLNSSTRPKSSHQAPKHHFNSSPSTKMATLPKKFNTVAGATPYKGLFTKVAIVPANCSLAFISTQFACDPETGELPVGMEGDYAKQSAKIWEQIVGILKELGVTMKEVVHVTVNFSSVFRHQLKQFFLAFSSGLPISSLFPSLPVALYVPPVALPGPG